MLFRIDSFSRNLRKEVSKSKRYYFVDNGIRNAVIDQFQPLDLRPDRGALWENFFVNERRRRIAYRREGVTDYFWRTYDQQEIDRIEVDPNNQIQAFECKNRMIVALAGHPHAGGESPRSINALRRWNFKFQGFSMGCFSRRSPDAPIFCKHENRPSRLIQPCACIRRRRAC